MPYKDILERRAANRRSHRKNSGEAKKRRLRLESSGLCIKCAARPRTTTSKRCEICSQKHASQIRTRKLQYVLEGRCHTCGKPRDNLNVQRCSRCTNRTRPKAIIAGKARRQADKLLVFNAYGGCKCACSGCLESNIKFLTIDHINNNGTSERKNFGSGGIFYKYLIKNNYPAGYQVLCYNCNCGRGANGGICPHVELDANNN